MKHIIILFLLELSSGALFAQQPDEAANRALEREVKTSGSYLYGEAVGNTKDEAVRMAKTDLVSEINKESLNHPEWQFAKSIQAKDVEYNTDIIELMRGSKFRVIAYIKKDSIAVVFDNKAPEIKLEDKKVRQEKEQIGYSATKTQPKAVQTTPAPAFVEGEVQSKKVVMASDSDKILYEPVIDNHTNTGDLLKQILEATSISEIQKILDKNKRTGKVVSGTIDKLIVPEKAYLIVYRKTGEIVAILDKGSNVARKDLLSGEMKGKEILEQNQVMWFQLF